MAESEQVVFLHGVGAGPASWRRVLADLPPGYRGTAPPILGLSDVPEPAVDPAPLTFARAAEDVIAGLDRDGIDRAHVCGLSLGAMVALRVAVDHPDRVASLVLSGGQVHPPRALMALQSAILRVLPERFAVPEGMTRDRFLSALDAASHADFRGDLAHVTVPTLVLCGSRDRPNLPAARALAAGIPGARLRVLIGGGHELNTDMPAEFAAELAAFWSSLDAERTVTAR